MRSSPDRRRDLRPQPARPETPSTPRLIRKQPPYQPSPTLPYSGQTTHVRKRALKSRRPVSSEELGQASPQPVSTRTLPRSGTQHPCFPKLHCPRPTPALSATTTDTTSLHRHKSLRPRSVYGPGNAPLFLHDGCSSSRGTVSANTSRELLINPTTIANRKLFNQFSVPAIRVIRFRYTKFRCAIPSARSAVESRNYQCPNTLHLLLSTTPPFPKVLNPISLPPSYASCQPNGGSFRSPTSFVSFVWFAVRKVQHDGLIGEGHRSRTCSTPGHVSRLESSAKRFFSASNGLCPIDWSESAPCA